MTRVLHRITALFLLLPALALAQTPIPSPPQIAADAYLLMDAHSGKVLVEHNADERLPPASLTKMMTSYVLAHELAEGNVALDDRVTISKKAWAQNPEFAGSSLMWIEVGKQVSLEDLDRGVIISSGNDASVAVAEYLAGSESAFADLMNQHAELLGMDDTHYVNAHGLPHPEHYTTARDLAILARALLDYPEQYALYSEKSFTYNNITQSNRNRLLWRDPTVDGIKTGHTEEAGYCLVASAKREGMRLISVVMGADSEAARERETQKLLSYGFRYFETHQVYEAGTALQQTQVWGGAVDRIPLGVAEALYLTIPRNKGDELDAVMHIDEVIRAPVPTGATVGELVVKLDGEELARQPLVTLEAVEQGGIFKRLWHAIVLFFRGLFS